MDLAGPPTNLCVSVCPSGSWLDTIENTNTCHHLANLCTVDADNGVTSGTQGYLDHDANECVTHDDCYVNSGGLLFADDIGFACVTAKQCLVNANGYPYADHATKQCVAICDTASGYYGYYNADVGGNEYWECITKVACISKKVPADHFWDDLDAMCKTDCKTAHLGVLTHANRWGLATDIDGSDVFTCTDDCWTLTFDLTGAGTHYNDYEDSSVDNDLCVIPIDCNDEESNDNKRYMFADKTGLSTEAPASPPYHCIDQATCKDTRSGFSYKGTYNLCVMNCQNLDSIFYIHYATGMCFLAADCYDSGMIADDAEGTGTCANYCPMFGGSIVQDRWAAKETAGTNDICINNC